jgi:hypothetical protein
MSATRDAMLTNEADESQQKVEQPVNIIMKSGRELVTGGTAGSEYGVTLLRTT